MSETPKTPISDTERQDLQAMDPAEWRPSGVPAAPLPASVPLACKEDEHIWAAEADAEGDTCQCGAWYRFHDHIKQTPERDDG